MTLTHSTAQIVQYLLVGMGLGTLQSVSAAGSWPVFRSSEPDTPDNCITVYRTVGTDDGRSMIDGELWSHHGFQVRVRGSDEDAATPKADAIRVALATQSRGSTVVISSTTYRIWSVSRIGQVLVLGFESPKSKRSLATLNAVLAVREV